MKPFLKLTAILVAALFASGTINAQSGKIKIGLEFEIGRPKKECTGFGICKVKVTLDLRTSNGSFEYDRATGNITWSVDETKLASDKLSYFQGQSDVTFVDDLALPADVKSSLGISSDVSLKAGTYSVSYAGGVYTVSGIAVR